MITLAAVNCWSSASLFPLVAKEVAPEISIKWIFVQTSGHTLGNRRFPKSFPDDTLYETVDPTQKREVDDFLRRMKALGVHYFIGGTDQGVYFANEWNIRSGFKDNALESRPIRHEKLLQSRSSGEHGIPTLLLKSVEEGMEFAKTLRQAEVVFKFNSGTGGFGLKIVSRTNKRALRKAIEEAIANRQGFFGDDHYLMQPKITGTEYCIETFSFEGKTVITGLWQDYKVAAKQGQLLLFTRPLPLDGDIAQQLTPIAKDICKRHGIEYGMAHIEFIREENGKWWLLENNPRAIGVGICAVEREVYGISQMDLYMLSILNPAKVKKLLKQPIRKVKDSFVFFIPALYPGKITAETLHLLEKMKTFFLPAEHFREHEKAIEQPTKNLLSRALIYYGVGEPKTLEKDFKAIVKRLLDRKLVIPTKLKDPESAYAQSILATETLLRREANVFLKALQYLS